MRSLILAGRMKAFPQPLDLKKVKVYPLSERRSLSAIEKMLVDPARPAPACPPEMLAQIRTCAANIKSARERGSSVMQIGRAHV